MKELDIPVDSQADVADKVVKIINSCKTLHHFTIAEKVVDRWLTVRWEMQERGAAQPAIMRMYQRRIQEALDAKMVEIFS